jgi:excisionase family DNA binding protein
MMEERISKIEANLDFIKALLLGNKKTLTLNEGCKYTGYSKSYMYKLTSGQIIPHLKRGKKVFFDKEELDAWLRYNKILDVQTKAKILTSKT